MVSNSQPVTTIDELKSLLGDHFVVLFGSAVSGVMEPGLPMIDAVTHTLLSQASVRLNSASYQEQVIAGYAQDMANKRGYHNALLKQTKFENFIFDLQGSMGKEAVDDLFVRIFTCTGEQYNNNHSALAFLLEKCICLAALTTNFDNQLELCLPGVELYIYPGRPARLPVAGNRPIVVKLHGDALSKTCVATSPELSHAKSLNTYVFIEELLQDQVVLVLGYSGTGDIDIAPHLGKYEKTLLWGNFSIEESKPKLPNQIDFICDLSLAEPGMEKKGRRNLLIELAASYGWKAPTKDFPVEKLKWMEEIVYWTQQIPRENLRDFITSFMSWRTSWPHVHITYLGLQKITSYQNRLDYALSTVQVAAYKSSEKLIKTLLLSEPPNLTSYLSTMELLGFTYWGQRRYQEALTTYLKILEDYKPESESKPDANVKKIISGIARLYLEILIEVVNNNREDNDRRELLRNSRADYVAGILKQLEIDTNYYLNQIAILETNYWLGTPVSLAETSKFFDQCMAMQEWEAAALTAQFMLTLSFPDGRKAVNEILPQLRKRGSAKLITKVNARLIYEQVNRRIPVQVLNFKAFTDILLVGVELIFAFKRLVWNLDRWLGWTRVETGFLSIGRVILRNNKDLD